MHINVGVGCQWRQQNIPSFIQACTGKMMASPLKGLLYIEKRTPQVRQYSLLVQSFSTLPFVAQDKARGLAPDSCVHFFNEPVSQKDPYTRHRYVISKCTNLVNRVYQTHCHRDFRQALLPFFKLSFSMESMGVWATFLSLGLGHEESKSDDRLNG